jgi:hypothetical protein
MKKSSYCMAEMFVDKIFNVWSENGVFRWDKYSQSGPELQRKLMHNIPGDAHERKVPLLTCFRKSSNLCTKPVTSRA